MYVYTSIAPTSVGQEGPEAARPLRPEPDSSYHLPLKGRRVRARAGKVQDKPGTSCFARKQENAQGMMGTCQKDIKGNLKGHRSRTNWGQFENQNK